MQGFNGNTVGRHRPGIDDPRRPRAAGRLHPQGHRHAERPRQRALRGDERGWQQGLGPLRRQHRARLREDQTQAAPGGPHRPRLGEQRRDAREPRRLVLPGLEPVARPEGRPACRRRQEGQPARHRPRLRRRRRPEMGLEGVPAGPQRALHGPVRRPRLGTDPRRSGGGRARRRGVPSRDGARAPLRRAHRPRRQPAGRRAGLDRVLPGGPRAGVPGLPPRRRSGDRGPLGCQGQTRRGVDRTRSPARSPPARRWKAVRNAP